VAGVWRAGGIGVAKLRREPCGDRSGPGGGVQGRLHTGQKNATVAGMELSWAGDAVDANAPASRASLDDARRLAKFDAAAAGFRSCAVIRAFGENIPAAGGELRGAGDAADMKMSSAGLQDGIAIDISGGDVPARRRGAQRTGHVAHQDVTACRIQTRHPLIVWLIVWMGALPGSRTLLKCVTDISSLNVSASG